MADDKFTRRSAQGMATLEQGAIESAENAYKRLPWELLDQGQKETLTLIWFAGFLAGRAVPSGPPVR